MKILESTFGYDMTINTYYLVVKDGEKTCLIQQIGRIVTNDDGLGGGRSIANPSEKIDKPFRAYKRAYDDRTIYVSKYFPGGSADEWNGQPSHYNSWD